MKDQSIVKLINKIESHERRAKRSLCFVPSENVISPLAKVPLIKDIYNRYFFDHKELFGEWFFFSGVEAGEIQNEFTVPLLKHMAKAEWVDVRPLSGLNCMVIAMASLCKPGGTMFTVPEPWGGHMSSPMVAKRLGIRTFPIPIKHFSIDLDEFESEILKWQPDLIYLDQSTQLFPFDPLAVREIVDRCSPETLIHYDSSHVNGLILAGAMDNPLSRGAHTFGGSTHKTLPGPHKGFLATNCKLLATRIDEIAYHYVSHHQVSAVISLGITLMELKNCDGDIYAKRIIQNAKQLARSLSQSGLSVAGADYDFTNCHQIWVSPEEGVDSAQLALDMYEVGLLVNKLPSLPTLAGGAFRLSTSEITRLGASSNEINELAIIFACLLKGDGSSASQKRDLRARVEELRSRLVGPCYCYTSEDLCSFGAPTRIVELVRFFEN